MVLLKVGRTAMHACQIDPTDTTPHAWDRLIAPVLEHVKVPINEWPELRTKPRPRMFASLYILRAFGRIFKFKVVRRGIMVV